MLESERPEPVSREVFDQRINALEDRLDEQESRTSERQQALASDLDASLTRIQADLEKVCETQAEQTDMLAAAAKPSTETSTEPDTADLVQTGQVPREQKLLLGRVEWAGLPEIPVVLKARIDSGAKTSSLSAHELTEFERDGEDWLRFKLALDEEGSVGDEVRDQWIEAPVIRRVRIIQASGSESRPVVSLQTTLGPIRQNVEFTLNDRTDLSYPVLLGRRFMMDIAYIDVGREFIHERPTFPAHAGNDEDAKE